MKDCICGHPGDDHLASYRADGQSQLTSCLSGQLRDQNGSWSLAAERFRDCSCEAYVSATEVGVPRMWDERAGRADRQWAAQAVWAALDDPRRAAVLLAVGERLNALLGSLPDWVPGSITLRPTEGKAEQAQALEVTFTVVLPVMTEREVDALTEAERARLDVVRELADFARQLGPR